MPSVGMDHASSTLSDANTKVFEDVAPDLASFSQNFASDATPDLAKFKAWSAARFDHGDQAKADGFEAYYQARFEQDAERKQELVLLGNVKIVSYEQAYLQNDIENVMTLTGPLGAIASSLGAKGLVRRVATKTMHLDVPDSPNHLARAQLGRQVTGAPSEALKTIENPDLREQFERFNLNPDSPRGEGSAAKDWGNYNERMQFITQHFRVNANNKHLLDQLPHDAPPGTSIGTIKVTSHLNQPANKVREFVSDLHNLEKHSPQVSNTTLDGENYGVDMKFMGLTYRGDMKHQKTGNGVDFAGGWTVRGWKHSPRITEQVSIQVQPAPQGGSLLTVTEDYQMPRWLKPIYPVMRWTIGAMIRKGHEQMDGLIAGQ